MRSNFWTFSALYCSRSCYFFTVVFLCIFCVGFVGGLRGCDKRQCGSSNDGSSQRPKLSHWTHSWYIDSFDPHFVTHGHTLILQSTLARVLFSCCYLDFRNHLNEFVFLSHFFCQQQLVVGVIYTLSEKKLQLGNLVITWSNINQFAIYFHRYKRNEIIKRLFVAISSSPCKCVAAVCCEDKT